MSGLCYIDNFVKRCTEVSGNLPDISSYPRVIKNPLSRLTSLELRDTCTLTAGSGYCLLKFVICNIPLGLCFKNEGTCSTFDMEIIFH